MGITGENDEGNKSYDNNNQLAKTANHTFPYSTST
ncbi:hypothetical protein NIES21_41340 [Anabaenopsis circularis NIES-21]|uniref:Uncharacterized protein n=1 Tax=Anabaenopsis circularis NIES-21 TaxID=1085406 RepID=A0A1Z4GLA9_9CYAN|nr:hypothetical protein NIES21_41340 [Anabaenopsis circularis NIES-21]